jgi:hypothetical protein
MSCVRDASPRLEVKLDGALPSCIFKVITGPHPRNRFLKHVVGKFEVSGFMMISIER